MVVGKSARKYETYDNSVAIYLFTYLFNGKTPQITYDKVQWMDYRSVNPIKDDYNNTIVNIMMYVINNK